MSVAALALSPSGERVGRGAVRERRLTVFAKSMRKASTEPEVRLWLALRAKRFEGLKFRRQKVIGPFIVDFAAREPMLAVEIDGDTHAGREAQDRHRTTYLESVGYRVLRFTNAEVMGNLDGVLDVIGSASSLPLSQPSPLKGRGL